MPPIPLAATRHDAPALLIIDLQQGMREPRLGPRNNPAAETRIAALLASLFAETC